MLILLILLLSLLIVFCILVCSFFWLVLLLVSIEQVMLVLLENVLCRVDLLDLIDVCMCLMLLMLRSVFLMDIVVLDFVCRFVVGLRFCVMVMVFWFELLRKLIFISGVVVSVVLSIMIVRIIVMLECLSVQFRIGWQMCCSCVGGVFGCLGLIVLLCLLSRGLFGLRNQQVSIGMIVSVIRSDVIMVMVMVMVNGWNSLLIMLLMNMIGRNMVMVVMVDVVMVIVILCMVSWMVLFLFVLLMQWCLMFLIIMIELLIMCLIVIVRVLSVSMLSEYLNVCSLMNVMSMLVGIEMVVMRVDWIDIRKMRMISMVKIRLSRFLVVRVLIDCMMNGVWLKMIVNLVLGKVFLILLSVVIMLLEILIVLVVGSLVIEIDSVFLLLMCEIEVIGLDFCMMVVMFLMVSVELMSGSVVIFFIEVIFVLVCIVSVCLFWVMLLLGNRVLFCLSVELIVCVFWLDVVSFVMFGVMVMCWLMLLMILVVFILLMFLSLGIVMFLSCVCVLFVFLNLVIVIWIMGKLLIDIDSICGFMFFGRVEEIWLIVCWIFCLVVVRFVLQENMVCMIDVLVVLVVVVDLRLGMFWIVVLIGVEMLFLIILGEVFGYVVMIMSVGSLSEGMSFCLRLVSVSLLNMVVMIVMRVMRVWFFRFRMVSFDKVVFLVLGCGCCCGGGGEGIFEDLCQCGFDEGLFEVGVVDLYVLYDIVDEDYCCLGLVFVIGWFEQFDELI